MLSRHPFTTSPSPPPLPIDTTLIAYFLSLTSFRLKVVTHIGRRGFEHVGDKILSCQAAQSDVRPHNNRGSLDAADVRNTFKHTHTHSPTSYGRTPISYRVLLLLEPLTLCGMFIVKKKTVKNKHDHHVECCVNLNVNLKLN